MTLRAPRSSRRGSVAWRAYSAPYPHVAKSPRSKAARSRSRDSSSANAGATRTAPAPSSSAVRIARSLIAPGSLIVISVASGPALAPRKRLVDRRDIVRVELELSRTGILFDMFHTRGFWNREEVRLAGQKCERDLPHGCTVFAGDALERLAMPGGAQKAAAAKGRVGDHGDPRAASCGDTSCSMPRSQRW